MWRQIWQQDLSFLPGLLPRFLLRLMMLALLPLVEIRHQERLSHLPRPLILAFNHNNAFEALAVPAVLIFLRSGRLIHFFVDWMYLRWPVLGWVLGQCRPIPVFSKRARWDLWGAYRRARRSACPVEQALGRLAAGGCLGIFPEGTRNGDLHRLRRGRLGIGRLVLESQAPVVPVGIRFPACQRLGRMPRVGRIRLEVGQPLFFTAERREQARLVERGDGDGRRGEELRRLVVHRVMTALSRACSKSYPFRQPAARKLPTAAAAAAFPAQRLEAS